MSKLWFSSVQFNLSVMSDSLWTHGLQHVRLPCPSLSPRVCSNSFLLSLWCYLTIASSVTPFPSCPQSFPASRSFPICYTLGLLFPYFCSVTQSCHVRLSVTPWTAACQTSLSFTISRSLLKLMSIELVMSPNGLILCHPLLLLPSIFPSIGVFCLFVSCLFYFQVFVSQVLWDCNKFHFEFKKILVSISASYIVLEYSKCLLWKMVMYLWTSNLQFCLAIPKWLLKTTLVSPSFECFSMSEPNHKLQLTPRTGKFPHIKKSTAVYLLTSECFSSLYNLAPFCSHSSHSSMMPFQKYFL